MALLKVEDITKHYVVRQTARLFARKSILRAVDGVSFSIPRGHTLGLVGESGCGKSTTAQLVLGLGPATSGRVLFAGETISAVRDERWRTLRRHMQMVYQDPLGALDRRMPVGEQVVEPLLIHGVEKGAAARRERALSLFEAVGLGTELFKRYPHELSGGQRQRVVLARALVLEPSLLVCDEPVSALDVSIQAQVVNLLQDVKARFDLSMLFISHDLKVVRQVVDEVAVMYLGRIIEQGPPDALFRQPLHPYTAALVSAIPTPRRRMRDRIVLSGDPPNPVDVPMGCAFHPRCPRAIARCRTDAPALSFIGQGRLAACHLVGGNAARVAA